ncbi:K(+)/H(+) antiporter [Savitreella phatthalungensis]
MSSTIASGASSVISSSARASSTRPSAPSVLLGHDPSVWDKSNPITVFLYQVAIVVIFCRILHWPLARIRQPRVIAEVIGGILLGPTAFGRIPGFTKHIFPPESMPSFNLVANFGLVLFLFIVGLEVDLRLVRKNARVALSVGLASLVLPFGTGCGMAWAVYKEYAKPGQSVGLFILFIGTAFSITAFPVLARILTELKLLRRDVGVTVLAAGVGNDVTGWMLLALVIALVNASTGLVALYTILLVIAWVLVLFYLVKPAYLWLARRSGMDRGPSDLMLAVTTLLVIASAFYTEIIGVHPIFGSFLVGMIMPHEHGWAVALTEKMEDLISVLFLPLYFASSGLKTNIGLLNTGRAWGYTIAICVTALFSKLLGSMLAARTTGFLWRESVAVGILMSCKGLVELIVLNVGLQAGILTQQVFTMFVIMALVTTFLTTPLTIWAYPTWYQDKVAKWRAGEIDWDGNALQQSSSDSGQTSKASSVVRQAAESHLSSLGKCMIVLDRAETVAPLLRFTHFLAATKDTIERSVKVHILRLLEMNDKLSQIIKVSESDDLLRHDPFVAIFVTAFQILGLRSSLGIHVLSPWEFARNIVEEANLAGSELLVAPLVHSSSYRVSASKLAASGGFVDGPEDEVVAELLDQARTNLCVLVPPPTFSTASLERPESRRRQLSMTSLLLRQPSQSNMTSATAHSPCFRQDGHEAEAPHVFIPLFSLSLSELLALRLARTLLSNAQVTSHIVLITEKDGEKVDPELFESARAAFASYPSERCVFEHVESANPVEQALECFKIELKRVSTSSGAGKRSPVILLARSNDPRLASFATSCVTSRRSGEVSPRKSIARASSIEMGAMKPAEDDASSCGSDEQEVVPSPRQDNKVRFGDLSVRRIASGESSTPPATATSQGVERPISRGTATSSQSPAAELASSKLGEVARLFVREAALSACSSSGSTSSVVKAPSRAGASVWVVQAAQ